MRRRIAIILGAVLAASALAVVTPAPASATDVCADEGVASTGPLFFPVTVDPTTQQVTVRQPWTVGFGFAFGAFGQCVSSDGTLGKTVTASGTLTGWCGHSAGQGVANDGANFAWVSIGERLIITGHLVGIVNMFPDLLLPGNSCFTGATRFFVSGALVLLHCAVLTSGSITIPIPSTSTLPMPFFHMYTGPMNYYFSVCAPGPL